MTEQHIKKLTEVIQNRQSVYPSQFTGEIIDKDAIQWILHNAIQAPSHKHVNPWRFHVFSGEKKQTLCNLFETTYKQKTDSESFSEKKFKSFNAKFSKSSHILLISMKPNAKRLVPEWENVASVATAMQNIYLSVTAAGFGGYWSSPAVMFPAVKNYLQLAEDEKCLGMFYLGVPEKVLPPKVDKGDIADYVQWYE